MPLVSLVYQLSLHIDGSTRLHKYLITNELVLPISPVYPFPWFSGILFLLKLLLVMSITLYNNHNTYRIITTALIFLVIAKKKKKKVVKLSICRNISQNSTTVNTMLSRQRWTKWKTNNRYKLILLSVAFYRS